MAGLKGEKGWGSVLFVSRDALAEHCLAVRDGRCAAEQHQIVALPHHRVGEDQRVGKDLKESGDLAAHSFFVRFVELHELRHHAAGRQAPPGEFEKLARVVLFAAITKPLRIHETERP